MPRFLKTLAALAAVVALLPLYAAPSAAATGSITGGTITVNLTPVVTMNLASTTGSCSSWGDYNFPTSLTSGSFTPSIVLLHFNIGPIPFIFRLTLNTYHVDSAHVTTGTNASKYAITKGSSTGTGVTATDVMIYASDSATDCDPSNNTAKCSNIDAAIPVITGLLTPNGSLTHSPTSRHTLPISSTVSFNTFVVQLSAAGCTPPFSALNGKTSTIAGMTIHVTS